MKNKILWVVLVLLIGAAIAQSGILGLSYLRALVREELTAALDQDAINIERYRERLAAQESAAFITRHMAKTPVFPDKFALFKHSLGSVPKESTGHYCEFGVGGGTTINHIASLTTHTVHGFDSFEGLPEDWRSGYEKGTFAITGLPQVRENVRLCKGWFDQSLPVWAKDHPGPMAFMHMDADLYSSTKTVFDILGDRVVPGTVIQFDEYFNYPAWQEGEYKAFQEFVQGRQIDFEYIGYTHGGDAQQVAVRIRAVGPSKKD